MPIPKWRRTVDDAYQLPYLSNEGDVSWMDDAACRDLSPDLFFPHRGDVDTVEQAKEVCRGCIVKLDCRGYARRFPRIPGVWGGLSEVDRLRGFDRFEREEQT